LFFILKFLQISFTRNNRKAMKTKVLILLLTLQIPGLLQAQNIPVKKWSLTDCIDYALKQNIDVRGSELSNQSNEVNVQQAKDQKLPSVNASVNKNFNWSNRASGTTGQTSFSGSNNTNYSVNSSVSLYNGLKLNTKIKQAELNLESSKFNTKTIKESVSLSVLDAFLQVLYTEEQVKNSEKQIESTTEQLALAAERLSLSIISKSDYLQVKSELASEKYTLANAKSNYELAKVSLEQLMELPVDKNFEIEDPDLKGELNQVRNPDAPKVYTEALKLKPQIKSAELNKQSTELDEKIARSDYYPSLSLNAGVGTGYSSLSREMNYFNQLNHDINPSVGLSLSIPIFQKNQVKNNIQQAKINVQNAELNQINTQNQLRKNIEQACTDVNAAQMQYEASNEKYSATEESYKLAEEKFKNGLINSVDFLIEKTNMIVAESDFLQSKYNLIFSYKILDFYAGNPIQL